ncbi:hypothetical protein HD554DRAFT_1477289 [Boletus coccyginus]|nr:hypothetical protein HD554DRAFT_1477289 [Boletus coccyginus]
MINSTRVPFRWRGALAKANFAVACCLNDGSLVAGPSGRSSTCPCLCECVVFLFGHLWVGIFSDPSCRIRRDSWASALPLATCKQSYLRYFIVIHDSDLEVPYLLGRISLLICLVLLVIELSPLSLSESFNCEPAIIIMAITSDIAVGAASTNLMIRTWVIWKNSRSVHLLLSLLTLGHWTILITNMASIRASRLNEICVFHSVLPGVAVGAFLYTMCYDFLVLLLSVVKLSCEPSKSPLKERLYAQGILYFIVAATTTITPTVFAFLGSDVMVDITSCFALTASTIVSCRAVRSLLGLRTPRPSDMFDENGEGTQVLTTQLPNQPSTMSMDV